MRSMKIQGYDTYHLVRSEDLNHHGTLFAGRGAEWFVESGFIAAASAVKPNNLVCVKIHGMHFSKPVNLGEVVNYKSKIVYAGRTSLIAHVRVSLIDTPDNVIVQGFITFVNVDENTKPLSHGIMIEAETPEDVELQQRARELKRSS